MASSEASVRTDDLEQAIDYLEGLVAILSVLEQGAAAEDPHGHLLAAVESMPGFGHSWEPLRYEVGTGAGWAFMARHVTSCRERLLERYTEAVL